jgi:GTPase SAR1 family protein
MIHRAIERIQMLAQTVHDETVAALAHDLAQQLPRSELNLLVVGQFKRGKSSLINALLRADVMPTGALPVTGVVTAIRFGYEPSVTVLFRQREPEHIAVADLSLYVSEEHNPANRLGVERVEVSWPAEAIRGVALFDTPGTGSTFAHNTAAAHAALRRADAAILVVGPEPPIGADELQYARDVVASSEHLFVVLNKSDIAGESLSEILKFTEATIKSVVADRQDVYAVPLSATGARRAQRDGYEDATFGKFVSSLRRFVEEHGETTRERSIRRRILLLLQRLDALVTMRIAALELPKAERARRKQLAERALQFFDDRVRSLELIVNDDVRQTYAALEDATDSFYERDVACVHSLAAKVATERAAQRRTERIEHAVSEFAALWRSEIVDLVSHRLRSDAAKYGRLLGEIEASALEAGSAALDISAVPLIRRDVEFAPPALAQISALTPTTGLELVVAVAVDLLPKPVRVTILKRRYQDMLAHALDALSGKLRHAMMRDIEPWRRATQATIASAIENVRRAVLSAFVDVAADTSEERDLEHARNLQRELADIEASIKNEQFASVDQEAKDVGPCGGNVSVSPRMSAIE